MQTTNIEQIQRIANEAAAKAADKIREIRQSGDLNVSQKLDSSLVTRADKEAEHVIIGHVSSIFPSHRFLAEETASDYNDPSLFQGPLWIIDPVDGTTNYSRGHNHVGVSIAFAWDGAVQYGVVHAPFLNEVYTARRGGGAYMNGKRFYASDITDLKSALVATGHPPDRKSLPKVLDQTRSVLQHCRDLMRLGSASVDLCWVASGRLDAYYEDVHPWDMAAGCLIAREAGAAFGHLSDGHPLLELPEELQGYHILVSASGIYAALKKLLEEA